MQKTLAMNFRAKKSELTSGSLMSSFDFFLSSFHSKASKGIEATVAQNDKSRDNNVQMRCLLGSNANLMNAIHLIVATLGK